MAKSESEAVSLFKEKLTHAVTGENVIYVISEKQHISLLPDGSVRILVKADIDTIKERFKMRMHGSLPAPVEQMLERKHGMFDDEHYDYQFDGVKGNASAFCDLIKDRFI